jgi:hypothetical protein
MTTTTNARFGRYAMKRGTTFTISFLAKREDGTVIDLTGLTGTEVLMRARRNYSSTDTVFTLDLDSGIEVTDATGGCATATIVPLSTSDLENLSTWLVYDVKVTKAVDDVSIVESGVIVVEPTTDI